MPRIHCVRKADGTPDWFWISALIATKVAVIAGYLRIYFFWLKCYRSEDEENRNKKLWQLANVFFICATTGYFTSILMFFWPAYRLTAILTFGLVIVTYSFMTNLKPFELTFSAVRLLRERDRAQQDLTRRNAEMRLILETVEQGFLMVELSGRMSEERPSVLARWFGPSDDDMRVWDYLGRVDGDFRAMFVMAWEAMIEDILPLDLALEQLPSRLSFGEHVLELAYRPVLEYGKLSRVLLVITDVTTQLQQERAEMLQGEVLSVFEKMMSDRRGVEEFFHEAGRLVHLVADNRATSLEQELRAIHTLKGTCGLFGIRSISQYCHDLETKIQADGESANKNDRLELKRLWEGIASRLVSLLGERADSMLHVADEDYDRLMAAIFDEVPRDKLARILRAWRFEPTRLRLMRLGEQAKALAERLGKGEIQLELESNALRLPPERWAQFWSAFSHVVRNAVDHGIESLQERMALGKPTPVLHLSTRVVDGDLVVTARDDGPGIDWQKLKVKAQGLGLPAETKLQLEAALFVDGLSTREVASEVSGRGVGMAAVKEAVGSLGGRIEVESVPGRGTTWRFVFPRTALSSAQRTPGHRVVAEVASSEDGVRSLFPSWPVGFEPSGAK